jgi:hypothetical protein
MSSGAATPRAAVPGRSDAGALGAAIARARRWLAATAAAAIISGLIAAVCGLAAGDAPQPGDALGRLAFVAALLAAAWVLTKFPRGAAVALAAGMPLALGALLAFPDGPLVWAALLILYVSAALAARRSLPLAIALAVSLAAGLVAWSEQRSRYSSEEFFALLQFVALAGLGLVAALAVRWALPASVPVEPARRAAARRRPLAALALVLLADLAAGATTLAAYRASFAPLAAPAYPGISAAQPFLCGRAAGEANPKPVPEAAVAALLARARARVAAHPQPGPPELAVLALGGEEAQARAFRDALLAEARAGRFTGPAGSVKSVQYDAALRVYFAGMVGSRYPALFSPDERRVVDQWFNAINRRALTVEPVDYLYALPFGHAPRGPYDNQEIGAGLLALLARWPGLDPELAAVDRAYLDEAGGGWRVRFRVGDDALFYQPLWIHNAYFQQLGASSGPGATPAALGAEDAARLRLAFEWLALQATPDGAGPTYNFPYAPWLAPAYLLGAQLTGDGRYLWLADRALAALERDGRSLAGQPGLAGELSGTGVVPAQGSCLLYGNSGPSPSAALTPDKLVLREDWDAGATYALINLRFSGWHRYRATGSLSTLTQDEPLVAEERFGAPVAWLPVGRQAFRDKRVPREMLNAVLVPRTGLDAALRLLSGVGSAWAQDPPAAASVVRFDTLGALDRAELTYGWHDWTITRSVYLVRDGPLVVFDRAAGAPDAGRAAVTWHLLGPGTAGQGDGALDITLAGGARLVLLPGGLGEATLAAGAGAEEQPGPPAPDWTVSYRAEDAGQLALASVFLLDGWQDARVTPAAAGATARSGPLSLALAAGAGRLEIVEGGADGLPPGAGGTLAVDGAAALVRTPPSGPVTVCYVAARTLRLAWPDQPADLESLPGRATWDGAALTLDELGGDSACFAMSE